MQNADYVQQRNGLIPAAVNYANRIAGINPVSNAERDLWNRAFHGKMNDLARVFIPGEEKARTIRGRA